MTTWESFFASHLPPTDYEDNRHLLRQFCESHLKDESQKIVLITSGGKIFNLTHKRNELKD
jgi:phosphopantothenate-cysteine ligase